jgi:hypothetical protein
MACARDGGLSFQGPAAGLDPPARAEDGRATTVQGTVTWRLEPATNRDSDPSSSRAGMLVPVGRSLPVALARLNVPWPARCRRLRFCMKH